MKALHPRATCRVRDVGSGWQVTVQYTQTFTEDELDDVEAALASIRGMGT